MLSLALAEFSLKVDLIIETLDRLCLPTARDDPCTRQRR